MPIPGPVQGPPPPPAPGERGQVPNFAWKGAGMRRGFGFGGGTDFRFRNFASGPSGVIPERSLVAMPSPGDYLGGLGAAPTVATPERTDTASSAQLRRSEREVDKFIGEYNAPTSTSAFENLMRLSGERGAAVEGAIRRESRDAASRAGYTGGFSSREKQASSDRMKQAAMAGMEAAHTIRTEALEGYGKAREAATALGVEYNRSRVAEGMANADRAAQAAAQQAMINLEHMGMGMQAHQAYANAKSEAQQLQAQLDSQYQSQRIDAARYMQMSESVQAQFATAMAQLEEESRQFDASLAFKEDQFEEDTRRFNREEQLRLAAQGRNQAGQMFGPLRPAPGRTFGALR